MNFDRTVSELEIPNTISVESRACPDQYVGEVNRLEIRSQFETRKPARDRPSRPSLILILESPHVEEFKGQVAPAKGVTGRNILKFLFQVRGLEEASGMPLIIVNAIQHQCSLGNDTGMYRDQVFSATWAAGGKDDFIARIRDVYREGDLFVCACTKGNLRGKAELRQLVYAALCNQFPDVAILRRSHPVRWNITRNRLLEWRIS